MNWTLDDIVFEDYGVSVSKAKGVLDLPKSLIPAHDWLDADGLEFSNETTDYRDKDRVISLYCFIVTDDILDFESKVQAFWDVISAADYRSLKCDYIAGGVDVYLKDKVVLKRHTAYHNDKQVGAFILKLTVPGDNTKIIYFSRYHSYTIIASVWTKDFRIQKTLQGDSYASLSFESNDVLDIRNGDFIKFDYDGNGYDLFTVEGVSPFEKKGTNKYIYKLKIPHHSVRFAHLQFLFEGEADFYYYANIEEILDLMIVNHERTGFNLFFKGTVASTVRRNHKFSNENCLEVLKRLCAEYELEYEILYSTDTWNFTINIAEQVATDTSVILQYGKGSGQYDLQRGERIASEYYTKLFCFGSDKNLKPEYREGMRRLSFDANPLSNISDYTEYREKTVYLDDIYPQRTAHVTGYYQKIFSENLEEYTQAERDLHPGGIYRIEDTTLYDINDYLLGGLTAKIRMKTGDLAGYEFEIEENGYDHDNTWMFIKPNKDEKGKLLPDADLQIAVGDEYTLVDIDQPPEYIVTAETELEVAAQALLDEHSVPQFVYKCTIDPSFVKAQSLYFEVGDKVTIIDLDYNINQKFRISALTYSYDTGIYQLSFSESAVKGVIAKAVESIGNLDRATEDTRKDTIESMRKDTETVGELRNKLLDPADDQLSADVIVRDESIDPRMLAYDAGVPQISIQNALVECNVDNDINRVLIGTGTLLTHHWREDTDSRIDIQRKKDNSVVYDPTRIWIIQKKYFTLDDTDGAFLYAKVNIEPGNTECETFLSKNHIEVKIENGFLTYKLGFISDSSSPRHPEMVYGNIKTVTPRMVSGTIGEAIENETEGGGSIAGMIGNLISNCKESFCLENTIATTETQLSSWGVVNWNDLVGSFTAVVTVYNKVGFAITTLKNVLGYDYTDVAHETEDDNEIISDGTITLVLSVDVSDVLKAVLTNMPTDAKRIVWCFERCCLQERKVEITVTIDGSSDVTAALNGHRMRVTIDGSSEVTATMDASGTMSATIDGSSAVSALMSGATGLISAAINGSSDVSGDCADEIGPIEDVNYGYLYNWFVVDDSRNIANSEWHVPSKTEGDTIRDYVGGFDIAGGELKEIGLDYWLTPNTGAINSVGFNARGAGRRDNDTGIFDEFKEYVSFWTTTLDFSDRYRGFIIWYDSDNFSWYSFVRDWGLSIRLIKDSTTLSHGETGTYEGNDGKVYRTICIGTQEWVADNLKETKYRNGDWITGFDGGTYTPISDANWSAKTTEAMCVYDDDEDNA